MLTVGFGVGVYTQISTQHVCFPVECSNLSRKSAMWFNVIPPINMQVMSKFLWGHRTPWLRRDVNVVTGVRKIFETSPFIAIHIRRGDRIVGQDVRLKHDVKVTSIVRGGGANAMPHKRLPACQKVVMARDQHDSYISTINT